MTTGTARMSRHQMVMNRICFACGEHIPEGEGVYVAAAWILVHNHKPGCTDALRAAEKDFSKSAKGRNRSGYEIRKLLTAERNRRCPTPSPTA